jgi:plastocyanin
VNRRTFVVALAVLAALFAACGESNKVGDESTLNFKEQANNRLGVTTTTEATTTTVAAAGAGAPGKAGVAAATTTTAAPVTTTTAAPTTTTAKAAPVTAIAINSDGGSSQFEPSQAAAYVGGVFRWTNTDSVPRSVEADDGSFRSPSIPPGGTFELKATKAGTVNYHDGTRPYAVGAIQVVAR